MLHPVLKTMKSRGQADKTQYQYRSKHQQLSFPLVFPSMIPFPLRACNAKIDDHAKPKYSLPAVMAFMI